MINYFDENVLKVTENANSEYKKSLMALLVSEKRNDDKKMLPEMRRKNS